MSSPVLSAYRNLLRSIRIAFNGDVKTLSAALFRARSAFESSPPTAENLIHAQDVAKFLRSNVVQGERQQPIVGGEEGGAGGREGKVGGEEEVYKLKIHEYTEKGDNESIKMSSKREKEETPFAGRTGRIRRAMKRGGEVGRTG